MPLVKGEVFQAPRPLLPTDVVATFDCGQPSINAWLRRHAVANQREDYSRTYVVTGSRTPPLAGFINLAAYSLLPSPFDRSSPKLVPGILIGRLGVSLAYQGAGLGRSLAIFGLQTALDVSAHIGARYAAVHYLDENARLFWEKLGFSVVSPDDNLMVFRLSSLRH